MHPRDFDCTESTDNGAARRVTGGEIGVRWLGTAAFEICCDGTTILIDPYLTRVGFWRFQRGLLETDPARVDAVGLDAADAIIVGHSHFDHLLDVPYVAAKTGAVVYGSQSTANVLRAAAIPPEQIIICEGRSVFEVGPFRVTLVPSQHSRFSLGGKVPFAGAIPADCRLPMKASGYRVGDVFSIAVEAHGRCLYHMGTADLVEEAIEHDDVDVLLMGIVARHATKDYVSRVFRRLKPTVVVPMHYDRFFRALDRPMKLVPFLRFARFVDEARAAGPAVEIKTLQLGGTMRLVP